MLGQLMRSCTFKQSFGATVFYAIPTVLVGLLSDRASAESPSTLIQSTAVTSPAAPARAHPPRIVRITIPESSIRVFTRDAGQTSLGSLRIQGLRIGNPQSPGLSGDMLVSGGAAKDREFCVDIARINNLFGLSFVFVAPSNADVYRLHFRKAVWAAQLPMASGELSVSVRARSGGQCRGPLLAAGWEPSGGVPAEVWVPYNGGQASAARMQVGKGPAESCIAIKDLLPLDVQAVQYNFICKMALVDMRCDIPITVQIQRDMGARSDPAPDRQEVHPPCLAALK